MKDDLASIVEQLRPAVPDARWVPRDNLHLTLSFLGHVPDERISAIADALTSAVAGAVDVPTRLDGLGAFPSPRRARVIWVGIADQAGGVAAVADAVAGSLEPLGFERERRSFTAHVTLARLRIPAPVTFPADVHVPARRFTIDRVTLFESKLSRPTPTYRGIAEFPFRRS